MTVQLGQRDLEVRVEPGHVVVVRWRRRWWCWRRMPVELLRLSLQDLGELVCLVSDGWEKLCPADRALRALQVANIIGGCP